METTQQTWALDLIIRLHRIKRATTDARSYDPVSELYDWAQPSYRKPTAEYCVLIERLVGK